MADTKDFAARLTAALALTTPPVAVSFSDVAPEGVAGFDGAVPAGCAFWQHAASRAFATSAADHAMCAIGVHTHNLTDAPASQPTELQDALEAMIGLDYVRPEEVAAIPVRTRSARHAIYGPLADFPGAPEVVLIFAHAGQGLILTEALSRVDGGAPPAMGRPACAVIPQVLNQNTAAMSLGCCGARAYLDVMPDSVALWALPGDKLALYCDQIASLAGSNQLLATFHARRRADVEAGGSPTVRDSLKRLEA